MFVIFENGFFNYENNGNTASHFPFSSQNTVQFKHIPAAATDWRVCIGVPGEFGNQGKYVQAFPKWETNGHSLADFVLTLLSIFEI